MSHDPGKQTHFGFREVPETEKAGLVGEVFSSVASRYDIMNDLMSLGVHRLWKRFAVSQSGLRAGDQVLDVAAGSGDLSRHFASRVGSHGKVVLTDINEDMLAQGRARMVDRGLVGNIEFMIADAEDLPFDDQKFDCVSISFGLRNVTRKQEALKSMCRVLKPGGRLLVLEFSKPVIPIVEKIYDSYSFNAIPRIGKLVTGDEYNYRYLVESIRKHPDQETLKSMMLEAGFDDVRYHNLSAGIVALHIGFKY
jgi:demethylmenaquinone methyltransferase/2-methoxy-6-polyprenyl-1,4-benzoquinol methylase